MSEVVVVATLQSNPGMEQQFEQELRKLIGTTHGEEGCILFAMHQLVEDPTRFCVVERWESRQVLDAHLASPHIAEYLERTTDSDRGAPRLRSCHRNR